MAGKGLKANLRRIPACPAGILCIVLTALFVITQPPSCLSLNVDEAIALAKENLFSYKTSRLKVLSLESLFNASFSPYLPTLDITGYATHHYASILEYDLRNYALTLSYTLFDGGKRKANREISRLNLDTAREDFKKAHLDLVLNVKNAFYSAIAQKEILEQRSIQLNDAKKDHEAADGRHKFGVAKLSDVLHASVRLEQARFNLVQAEGDFRKALSEFNSLTGRPLDAAYDLEGQLNAEIKAPDRKALFDRCLGRPEIRQAENSMAISDSSRDLAASLFFPELAVNTSYSRTSGGYFNIFFPEEKSIGITASWNIFELGKFYKHRSSEIEKDASTEQMNELKRRVILETDKAFEDFITAKAKLSVAHQQLRQAEYNYSQAFGEYKVGKADILSLVQAESSLSSARELVITSRLNLIMSKSLLEHAAGIENLESIGK